METMDNNSSSGTDEQLVSSATVEKIIYAIQSVGTDEQSVSSAVEEINVAFLKRIQIYQALERINLLQGLVSELKRSLPCDLWVNSKDLLQSLKFFLVGSSSIFYSFESLLEDTLIHKVVKRIVQKINPQEFEKFLRDAQERTIQARGKIIVELSLFFSCNTTKTDAKEINLQGIIDFLERKINDECCIVERIDPLQSFKVVCSQNVNQKEDHE
jgi:hypothetical protein